MPVLNARFVGQGTDARGRPVPTPDGSGLRAAGPRVQCALFPLEAPSEPPVGEAKSQATGFALIDTGAAVTCVDAAIARSVGLSFVDSGRMASATHASELVPIFAGRLDVGGVFSVEMRRAYGANLAPLGFVASIGRDILESCVFVYNGADGSFSLSL